MGNLAPEGAANIQPAPFNWDAKNYAHVSQFVQAKEAEDLLSLHTFVGNELVLDVGCGDGNVAVERMLPLLPKGRIMGVDNDAEMHRHASAVYSGSDYEQVAFILADARELYGHKSIIEESLGGAPNLIFSNATLHHLYTWKEHHLALRNILDSAAAGATFLGSFAGRGNFAELREALEVVAGYDEYRHFFKGFSYPLLLPTVEQYELCLEIVGFKVSSLELKEITVYFPDFDAIAGWIATSMRSYNIRMTNATDGEKRDFAQTAAEIYLEKNPREDKGIPLKVRDILFSCTKRS